MLKPKERQLAEIMASEPSLSNAQYAERINVSEKTVYVYKRKPEFNEYLSALCKERFADMEKLAVQKLKEQVKNNNWKAIQYVLDNTGYKMPEQQEIQMSTEIIKVSVADD